jgi:outer membrane protein assembly factor BamB
MERLALITVVLLGVVDSLGVGAGELPWPQFRGSAGAGVATEANLPVEIGPDKNVKWKVAVPGGLSSPIVAGELLVLTAFEDDKLLTITYRRDDGAEAWRREAPAKQIEKYYAVEGSPAASTPATDGERIVSYFGSCGLVCYNLAGDELWKYELPPVVLAGNFGSGVSPIVADGAAILVRDETKDAKILAVDVAPGKLRWETKRQSPVSYCTPVVWETPAGKQIVAAGHARMAAYDLATGKETWFLPGLPTGCCASPVVHDGNLLFAGWSPGGADDAEFQMPSFEGMLKDLDKDGNGQLSKAEGGAQFGQFFDGQDANSDGTVTRDEYDAVIAFMKAGKNIAFAVKPGGMGDVGESHVLWRAEKGLPYVTSAIAVEGQYLMIKDGGIVSAYDPRSGKQLYMERVAPSGSYYASPVAAGANVYFTSLDEGIITVIKAGGDKPKVIAKNPPLGERVSATPAIAGDTLYVRTAGHLYAFAEK